VSWIDLAAFAIRDLGRRGARSVLSGLAVTLGTTLLVALLSISATAQSRVVSQLSKGGPIAAIHVDDAQPAPNALASDDLKTGAHHDIGDTAVAAIRSAAHVVSVDAVLSMPAEIVPCPASEQAAVPGERPSSDPACRRKVDPYFASLVGTDLSKAQDLPVTVLAGRLPQPGSLTEVAVTQSYFDHLQADPTRLGSVLNTVIEIATPQVLSVEPPRFRGRWFQAVVVGVVAQSVEQGDFLLPIQQVEAARQFALGGVSDPRDGLRLRAEPYSALVVVADSLGDVHTVRQEIAAMGYASSAPEHLVASVQKYLHVVDIVLGAIGGISLTIAALGVANSMLGAVRERWRDIGVMKAIGARDGDVLRWFLIEAAALGAAGGIAGTLVGAAVAYAVGVAVNQYLTDQGLQGIDLGSLPLNLLLVSPLATTLLAMLAGIPPALRAARMPAREALGSL
jgi:putative ABC transport system permease protein